MIGLNEPIITIDRRARQYNRRRPPARHGHFSIERPTVSRCGKNDNRLCMPPQGERDTLRAVSRPIGRLARHAKIFLATSAFVLA
jgi:hypothetical protein